MVADVVLLREKDDDDSPSGKKMMCYLRKVKVTVKPDQKNIWLTFNDNDKRIYVKNLERQYTYMLSLTSDPQVSCKKISEKRISEESAKLLNTGYVYSKYEKLDENTELLGQFVKPQ